MKDELEFISVCFNIDYNRWASKKIEYLAKKELDWDFILRKLTQSEIAPLAFHNLPIIKNHRIPKQFMDSLSNVYKHTLVKNIFIWEAFERLLNAFNLEKISAIPLKGVFMLGAFYKNIGLRPVADIDLLIKEQDLDRIDALLLKDAYVKIKKDPFTVSYIKKEALIELHYKLKFPLSPSIPHDFIWKNSLPEKIGNTAVSYPSLEDAVIYSALHFSRHLSYTILCLWSFPGLKNILDIHEILSKKESAINWGYIAKTSKKYKITSIVYSGLYLSKKYFNTRLPIRYLSSVEPNFFKRKILETFLLNKYLQLMDARNKSEIGLFTYSHETNLIYACLFEEDYFKRKLFSYPIKAFAEEHKLPYPSFKTSILYLLRIFLFIKMLLLKNRNSVKP